jgi:hypothetical protein
MKFLWESNHNVTENIPRYVNGEKIIDRNPEFILLLKLSLTFNLVPRGWKGYRIVPYKE